MLKNEIKVVNEKWNVGDDSEGEKEFRTAVD